MRSIRNLYNDCRELGVVADQREFSMWWARKPSWTSSSISRSRQPTVAALVAFYLKLEKIRRATAAELQVVTEADDVEALQGGLIEIEAMRNEVWAEVERTVAQAVKEC